MTDDDDGDNGAPAWMVTYGDMMSLLLTFFIVLVSMSELKRDDRFQGVANSIEEHFGSESVKSELLAEGRPRDELLAAMAAKGRNKRETLLEVALHADAGRAEIQKLKTSRPGNRTAVGTVIYFADVAVELNHDNRAALAEVVESLSGKPQKIEIRGHTSRRPVKPEEHVRDNWDLAYQRARNAMQFLVEAQKIDPQRIRIVVAGPHEPLQSSADMVKLRENPRVEVFLLEEVIDDDARSGVESTARLPRP